MRQGFVAEVENADQALTFNRGCVDVLLRDIRVTTNNKHSKVKAKLTLLDKDGNKISDRDKLLLEEGITESGISSNFNDGVWTAEGSSDDVNDLLKGLKVDLGEGFNQDFNISVEIEVDGFSMEQSKIAAKYKKIKTAKQKNEKPEPLKISRLEAKPGTDDYKSRFEYLIVEKPKALKGKSDSKPQQKSEGPQYDPRMLVAVVEGMLVFAVIAICYAIKAYKSGKPSSIIENPNLASNPRIRTQ